MVVNCLLTGINERLVIFVVLISRLCTDVNVLSDMLTYSQVHIKSGPRSFTRVSIKSTHKHNLEIAMRFKSCIVMDP